VRAANAFVEKDGRKLQESKDAKENSIEYHLKGNKLVDVVMSLCIKGGSHRGVGLGGESFLCHVGSGVANDERWYSYVVVRRSLWIGRQYK